MKIRYIIQIILLLIVFASCESEAERQQRLAIEEQQRIEIEAERVADEAARALKSEQARTERENREEAERKMREARLEKERQEKAIYDKYINNSLKSGSTPYAYCFGRNSPCSNWGCSQIKVKTPYNSDVLVTIKKG